MQNYRSEQRVCSLAEFSYTLTKWRSQPRCALISVATGEKQREVGAVGVEKQRCELVGQDGDASQRAVEKSCLWSLIVRSSCRLNAPPSRFNRLVGLGTQSIKSVGGSPPCCFCPGQPREKTCLVVEMWKWECLQFIVFKQFLIHGPHIHSKE